MSDALRIEIPRLKSHQQPIADHPARFKVVRAGRRWGKDRLAFTVSIVGHGPNHERRGLMHGLDVVWLAPDYPQAKIIWREEIKPRFRSIRDIRLNESEHTVEFPNKSNLLVRSNESIEGVRGSGKRLGGIVINEAAHFDLEYAWRHVIRPALADNRGWALIMSTTNGGHDGNPLKKIPSFFNRLCAQIANGQRSPDQWAQFHGTGFDNPTLPAGEMDELVRDEYTPDSAALKQEIYAELIAGGGMLALPELNERVHLIKPFAIPSYWERFGAFDWGFSHPWVFGDFAVNEDGDVFLVETIRGRKHYEHEIAERIKEKVNVGAMRYIHAGHDCWADRKSQRENIRTIQEDLFEHGISLSQANISRINGYRNLARYIHWRGAGPSGEDWTPRFRIFDTPGNRWGFQQLQNMVTDPLHPEDVLKVDADQETGEGGDDAYDMTRYGLASRPILAHSPWKDEQVDAWAPEMLAAEAKAGRISKRRKPESHVLPEAVT